MRVDLGQARISQAQRKWLAKDQYKASNGTCLLASEGSTGATGEYIRLCREAGERVNDPREGDVCFVSVNGMRSGRKPAPVELIRKAAELGCSFLTDAQSRRPEGGNSYNIGEQEVAELLRSLGYQEQEEHQGQIARWIRKKENRMRIINLKNEQPATENYFYCGRPGVLGNPFSHMTGTLAQYKTETREEAIECYRQWLWQQIKQGNQQVLQALRSIREDTVLGCWCVPLPCHCQVIIKAWQWLRQQK